MTLSRPMYSPPQPPTRRPIPQAIKDGTAAHLKRPGTLTCTQPTPYATGPDYRCAPRQNPVNAIWPAPRKVEPDLLGDVLLLLDVSFKTGGEVQRRTPYLTLEDAEEAARLLLKRFTRRKRQIAGMSLRFEALPSADSLLSPAARDSYLLPYSVRRQLMREVRQSYIRESYARR